MKVQILQSAKDDLVEGYRFYNRQSPGLGDYFLDSLYAEIDSLVLYGGIHSTSLGYHRCLSRSFPFGIYYRVKDNVVVVHAVLDCRRKPTWLQRKLHPRG